MASEFNPMDYINAYLQMENNVSDEMNDAQHQERQDKFLRAWDNVIPSMLYHYMPFSQKYHVESLVLSRLWFSYPMYFNDPNDSRILLNFELRNVKEEPSNEFLHDYYTNSLNRLKDNINMINRKIEQIYENQDHSTRMSFKKYFLEKRLRGYYETTRILEKSITALNQSDKAEAWDIHYTRYKTAFIEAFLSGFDKEIGICSFSTKQDNLLMWTHYANQSQGICIGYKKEEVIDKLGIIFPVHYERPVYYEELLDMSKPVIDWFNCRNQYLKRFLFKTNEWKYEDEWRALLDTKEHCADFSASSKGFLSPVLHPCVIYIGNNAETSDVDFIKTYCESNQIQCYKMRIEESSWNFGKPDSIFSPASNPNS